jgi:hypothetical protein
VSNALTSFLEQRFSTLPVSIVGQGIAIYALSIRAPGTSGIPLPGQTFIFPMSPQNVRKEPVTLTTIYDVQGPPSTYGVTRQGDQWGQAPPTYLIRGTTGWKRHSTDGFLTSGKQAIGNIQALLSQYAQLNQEKMLQGATQFYTLEFYDYWMNDFWQVEPVGPQVFEQSADRPIITYYTFRLACIRSVSAPIPPLVVDLIGSLFSAGAQVASGALVSGMAKVIGNYL